jgi:hypothetical protein
MRMSHLDYEPIAACRRAAELLDALADALEDEADDERVDGAKNAVAAALEIVGRSFLTAFH